MVKFRNRFVFSFLSLILPLVSSGQESFSKLNTNPAGTLRMNLGLTQYCFYKYNFRPLFADGFAEYFIDGQFSVKGNFIQYVTDRNLTEPLLLNLTGLTFGGAFHTSHVTFSRSDFAVIFQPGILLTNLTHYYSDNNPRKSLIPSLDISLSYTLTVSRMFLFYLTITHRSAWFRGTQNGSMNISGFSLTGGLGFHFMLRNTGKTEK